MKYLVDISQKHAEKIQELINQRQYSNVAQFIITAIENQIYLENSDDSFLINQESKKAESNTIKNNIGLARKSNLLDEYNINYIDSCPTIVLEPSFSELSISLQNGDEKKTWLWGQINKILPIKIGVRILYKMLDNKKDIELEIFRKEATEYAAYIGNIIREFEDKNNKIRGDRISAGLPNIYEIKSKTRYKTQFLAYQRKDGLLDGSMAVLRFAQIGIDNKKGKRLISITESGLKFAKLENPVLDKSDFEHSINNDEINFYLSHVEENVKSESAAIKWLLEKLNEGIVKREAINLELKNYLGNVWKVSDAVINTQRTGLMARMFELGLIEKKKNGIHVTYNLSNYGKSILQKLKIS